MNKFEHSNIAASHCYEAKVIGGTGTVHILGKGDPPFPVFLPNRTL